MNKKSLNNESIFTSSLRHLASDETLAGYFGSVKFRLGVLLTLAFIVVLIYLLIWQTLESNYRQTVDSIERDLKITLSNVFEQTHRWVHSQERYLAEIGHNHELVALTKRLLNVDVDAEVLANSAELAATRRFFDERADEFGEVGFFIINPDRMSIGSRRDSNLGTINLIEQQRPDLLRVVFGGTAVFIPPIESDITFEHKDKLSGERKPLTIFFAAPIIDEEGEVIAVVTQRVRRGGMLSQIMWDGQIGDTGESYAIDKMGRLVSDSRFPDQLVKVGLLVEGEVTRALTLRDPGGDLLNGYRPTVPRSMLPLTHTATSLVQVAQKSKREVHGAAHDYIISGDFSGHRDYRGIPVFSVWLWDAYLDIGMISEINMDEALDGYYTLRKNLFILSALALLLASTATIFLLFLARRAYALSLSQDVLEILIEERTSRLIEIEERNQLLLESIGEGIYGLDTQGRTIFVNSAVCEMLGYTQDELIGCDMHALMHHSYPDGSSYPREDCYIYSAFTTGAMHKIDDEVFWRKDGTGFPVEYVCAPVMKEGEIIGSVVTFRDVTERKKAELALVTARDEADTANRAKSEFLSSMSHELRTPMNAILGFGQLLDMEAEGFNETQHENIKEILEAGYHLLNLINEVLDLAKIESGNLVISMEEVYIDDLLKQCFALISTQIEARRLKLVDNISCHGFVVKADYTRLKQVMLNLLSNAVKYNSEQGNISLDAEIIDQKKLRICVTDTGDGLSENEIKKLFTSFERLNAKDNVEGTGIGLVITKHLIELMGGSIGVESTPGEGSVFWVELELFNQV